MRDKNLALTRAMDAVRAFHTKNGFTVGRPLIQPVADPLSEGGASDRIKGLSGWLATQAETMESGCHVPGTFDDRVLRTHLMLEELGESLQALAARDERLLFDGLVDLLYVLVGTAVAYDLPLAEGFEEVHASNMTKSRQNTGKGRMCKTVQTDGDVRIRDKGPNYVPPDLERVLREYRARTLLEATEVERNADAAASMTVAMRCLRCERVIKDLAHLGDVPIGTEVCTCRTPVTHPHQIEPRREPGSVAEPGPTK
jgi:hypothetical protein